MKTTLEGFTEPKNTSKLQPEDLGEWWTSTPTRYKNGRSKPPTGKEPSTVLALVVRRTDLVAPPSMGSTSWKRKFGFGGKEGGDGLG